MSKVVAPEEHVVPEAASSSSSKPTSTEMAVKEFFMWKNMIHTGTAFASINAVFFLIIWRGWSVLGLLGVSGILLLVGSYALAKATGTGGKDSTPVEMKDVLTQSQITAITKAINVAWFKIRGVLRCDDFDLFVKALATCFAVSITGCLFSFMFLLYVGVWLAFLGPLVYDKYQSQIDKMLLTLKLEMDKLSVKFMDIAGDKIKELQAKLKGAAAPASAAAADKPKRATKKID